MILSIEFSRNILKYWRNSIADSSRISINLKKNKSAHIKEDSFTSGFVPHDEALHVISKLNINTSNIKNSTTTYFDAHISPLCIKPKYDYATKNNYYASREIHPMWIPCKLQLNVTLEGHYSIQLNIGEICTPWFARDVLSPQITYYNSVIISDIDAVDDYLTQHGRYFETDTDWDNYISYADKMFSKITGSSGWKNFNYDGCFIKNEYTLTLTKIDQTSKSIIKAYDCILEKNSLPPLLKNITSRNYSDIRSEINQLDWFNASVSHKGQMTNIHSLADSQRKCLLNYTESAHGEVFACSGPAGTGKTTLIQNILATELVSRAVNEEDAPVIIASSTNNQAITNILTSFADSKTEGNSNLVKRWLPDVHSFGLYLPSKTAREKLDKYADIQVSQDLINPDGFAAMVLDKQYLQNAEKVFLEKFHKHSKKATNNINEAFDYLKHELKSLDKILCAGPMLWKDKLSAESALKDQATLKTIYETEIINLELQLDNLSKTTSEIEISRKSCPWWVKLFFLLQSSKKYIESVNKLIFLNNSVAARDIIYSSYTDVKIFLFEDISKKLRIVSALKNELLEFEKQIKNYEEIVNKWNEWKVTAGIKSDPPQAVDELDRTIRFKMFYTAVHYYEAQFLVSARKHSTKDQSTKAKIVSNIKLLANITPCYISTFQMNLKNFSSWAKKDDIFFRIPLQEIADLLIIDEAGQVISDISGASFYLAKKAFVVGDVKQIEPVYKIPLNIDQGNMIKASISSKEDIEDISVEMHNKGFSVTKGSIMKLAQKSCCYKFSEYSERGFMLLEHRRCPDTIIAYCNELCYNGQLIPMTGERTIETGLPFFAFANVTGNSTSNFGSRSNTLEAEIIAEWISRHKDEFESQFNNTIDNIICVITPFSAQAREIKSMLHKYKVKVTESEFKIGTVHALQGSSRPIVIFSSTYGANDKNSRFFFDRTECMLNVAVSRAKYSFIVFGYMRNFNPASTTPSGILAKYLFSSNKNEITDIMQTPKISINEDSIVVLNTHEKHIEHLRHSINEAKKEIIITSPFISIHAVKSSSIIDDIKSAADRNVKVLIYTDSYFDYKYGKQKQNSIDGHTALKNAGAIIKIIDKMHNKTLVVDDQSFSEGSLNWLSAVGNNTCIYNRLERTIVYSGPDAAKLIKAYKISLNKF